MKSPYKGKTGLKRLINAFGYSIAGTLAAFKQNALKILVVQQSSLA
jgi:diacylglycerol kinase